MRPAAGVAATAAVLLALVAPVPARAAGPLSPNPSPLASNGFESPTCTSPALEAQLSARQQTNCSISGVAVAPVPLSNYAIDVNVSSGIGASFGDDIDSVVQDLFVTPIWTALVWLVHVVLIALEWCYSLDLLAPATLSRAAGALGSAKRLFTDPWLGLVLAVAAIGFAWQGLVRRRVLDTLGRAGVLGLMVAGGLWIIADPVGTVGAVGNLADQAALATVAASATGDPSRPAAGVDGALSVVFDSVVSGPWCYLEFGDVSWCRNPAELDPRLRVAGQQYEQAYRAAATCHGPAPGLVVCAPQGSAQQAQYASVATALGEADDNGALFLALPAGTIGRTTIVSPSSLATLYQVLCGASDPTACTAPTAPQAEFRTASGTWPRVGGLVLIVAGSLGMLLLFGFIALRLLGAALATLLYLMLAPLAVLAPALGDGGRDTFRLWLTRLVGSLLAKLVYSVALGVVLLIVTLLTSLDELGWWTQWLLVSVFWWTAFEHRHRLLSLVMHERDEPMRRAPLATRAWLAGRSAGAGAAAVRSGGRTVFRAGAMTAELAQRWRRHPPDGGLGLPPRGGGARPGARTRAAARAELRTQADRMLAVGRSGAGGEPGAGAIGPTGPARVTASGPPLAGGSRDAAVPGLTARAARLDAAIAAARGGGDRRRLISLERRRADVATELARRSAQTAAPSRPLIQRIADGPLGRTLPAPFVRAAAARSRARVLNRAARAPAGAPRLTDARAAALAGLAGISPAAYTRGTLGEQRSARVEIERQLGRRRELLAAAQPAPLRLIEAVLRRERPAAAAPAAEPAIARRRRQFRAGPR